MWEIDPTDAYSVGTPKDYLIHTEFPVDELVWLRPDDVAAGRDTVVNAALTGLHRQAPRRRRSRHGPDRARLATRSGSRCPARSSRAGRRRPRSGAAEPQRQRSHDQQRRTLNKRAPCETKVEKAKHSGVPSAKREDKPRSRCIYAGSASCDRRSSTAALGVGAWHATLWSLVFGLSNSPVLPAVSPQKGKIHPISPRARLLARIGR